MVNNIMNIFRCGNEECEKDVKTKSGKESKE